MELLLQQDAAKNNRMQHRSFRCPNYCVCDEPHRFGSPLTVGSGLGAILHQVNSIPQAQNNRTVRLRHVTQVSPSNIAKIWI